MVPGRLSLPLASTPPTAALLQRCSFSTRTAPVYRRHHQSTASTPPGRGKASRPPASSRSAHSYSPLHSYGIRGHAGNVAIGATRGMHSTAPRAGSVKTFNLADIGEGITECEIIKWSITPGARIHSFDPLCEVQSDKASVEITSPFDGIVKQLLVQEGEIAKVGGGLCLIEVEEEEGEGAATPPSSPASSPSTEASLPTNATGDQRHKEARKLHPLDPSNPTPSRALGVRPPPRGQPAFGGLRSKDLLTSLSSPSAAPSPASQPPASSNLASAPTEFAPSSPSQALATPSVRHFAKQNGIPDLSVLGVGSGKGGRIEMGDVEGYLTRIANGGVVGADIQGGFGGGIEGFGGGVEGLGNDVKAAVEKDVVVELGRIRWNMWKAMERSLEIPHFGYSTSLDITDLHNLLPLLNNSIPTHYLPPSHPSHAKKDKWHGMVNPSALHPAPSPPSVPSTAKFAKLTYLPFLLKTLGMAMMEWPLMRSSINPSLPTSSAPPPSRPTYSGTPKPTLTIRPTADISLALSTPTGLYTPTLPHVPSHTLFALASRVAHLAALGRAVPCKLGVKEMPRRGGTVSVSNVGAVGRGEGAAPVLVPGVGGEGGAVAIVALGRARWVWDVEEEFWGEGEGEEGGMRGQRRLKLPVSWSADHRVVEGAELAAFVECWRGYVENPVRLIGECV